VCGRYTLTSSGEELAEAFDLDQAPPIVPRYNIAPTQPVLAVRRLGEAREAAVLRWGVGLPINVRSESVGTRGALREAFRERRCLLPADGFYEWRKGRDASQPFHFRRGDRRPFGLAGLWNPGVDGALGSCVLLTTEPNPMVAAVHDRMPVIVAPESYRLWLDPGPGSLADLQALLRPAAEQGWEAQAVSPAVNSAAHDGPQCLAPAERPRQALLFRELDPDMDGAKR
jgi:putative SOS response-associated peptidase YedK